MQTNDITRARFARLNNTSTKNATSRLLVRIGACLVLAVLLAGIFYSGSSASSLLRHPAALVKATAFVRAVTGTSKSKLAIGDLTDGSILTPPFSLVDPPLGTYAPDCSTPKSTFNLGDVVCARVSGLNLAFGRSFSWVDPAGFGRQVTPITDPNQSDSFTLPSTQTSTISGFFVVDNRGTWKVNVVSSRGVVLSQTFNVQGATPTADLSLVKALNGSSPNSGDNFGYTIALTNFGPNDATNVQLSDPQPLNATFVSAQQLSGPPFTCTGSDPVVCTPDAASATLPVGATALFQLTYTAGAADSTVTNIATVTSDTAELNAADNTANSGRVTIGGNGTPPTCTLECPNDITVATNANQGGPGAIVTFPAADTFGTCGPLTTSPASGSFFTVGTHSVSVTASGGGSCTFNVTVIDVASPTIVCPADQSATAPSGQSETSVAVGSPTVTGDTVTVSASRSDQRDESDPYPLGVTTIVWTAKDQFDRQVSCTQTITVTSVDAPTISCPANRTFAANSGDCSKTLTAGDIGTPTTGGLSGTLVSSRSDGLDLVTDPYPAGQTVITWTFTNAIGSVSCTETITITTTGDTIPPVLTIPPDLNVTTTTCTALLDDELGVATATDNCTPSVSITRTGIPQVSCPIPGNPTRMCDSFIFPVGTTDITYTATDASGNTAIGIQHVTVHELTPPTFTFVPGNLTVNTGPGATSCSTFVGDATLGTATVFDNCDTTVIRTGVPAGNIFPVGNTTITYTAKADITVHATQIVTVVDNTAPVVTAPGPVTINTGPGATSCGVTVSDLNGTFGTGSATDNCAVGPVTRSGVPLGGVFPVGQTTLTYSATDTHGNTGSANQLVTVVDNTPPTISCQADIIADFNPAFNGAVVTYTAPVGTDNCASTTTQIAGLPSGSTFPTGTTTNTFKVTDASGNTAQCSFKVTVALTSLIGLDSVTITGSGYADSYNSSGGYPATKSSLANILSNGTITIGGSGKVWGNVRSTRANVAMTGSAQVTGNATAGTTVTTSGSATVLGTRTNNALAPVMTLPSVPACSPFSSSSGITGTFTYSSSTGDLTLSGVNIATLANGNYCFHNITLGNSTQLKVNGPVVIKMTGTLNTSGSSNLNNTTQIPSNLQILSSYSGTNGVVIGNSVSVYALIYSPQTGLNMSGSAPLFGTAAAKTLTIGNSGAIHYDTQLKSIWPAIWTLIFGP